MITLIRKLPDFALEGFFLLAFMILVLCWDGLTPPAPSDYYADSGPAPVSGY